MVIMEENKGYAATLGSCAADPYFCSLAANYATDTAWYGISHPSAPNYVAFASGGTQGVSSDCTPPGCGPFSVPSLGGQLTAAGVPWRAYMESMPSPCYSGAGSSLYAEKHNPFLYFSDVRAASNCATVEVPYPGAAGLVTALGGTGAPDFVWITPNLANDMHSGTVQQGDAWLKANLGPVLASPWFTGGDATVVVTMDENDAQSTPGGGQVPLVVISSNTTGKGSVTVSGNHYGMLRSIEEAYGLGLLGGAATGANGDLVALFGGPAA
jgi:acid phosphatase